MREAIMDRAAQVDERRGYTVADFDWLLQMPEYADGKFELIEGEIITMDPVGFVHGHRATRIERLLDEYAERTGTGMVTTETGYYRAGDGETLLAPDVAFTRMENLPSPDSEEFVPVMPDLAVEIKSPNDTFAHMRRKAELYLRRGTQIVWLVYPERRGVEVCTLQETGEIAREFITEDGSLSGGDALPGFVLELRRLFS